MVDSLLVVAKVRAQDFPMFCREALEGGLLLLE